LSYSTVWTYPFASACGSRPPRPGIARPSRVLVGHVDAEPLASVGQEIGHEHVGLLGKAQNDFPAFRVRHIDGHAPLAPVGDLPHAGESAGTRRDVPGVGSSHRIRALWMLDLYDLAPHSARIAPADGTYACRASSSTRTPANGLDISIVPVFAHTAAQPAARCAAGFSPLLLFWFGSSPSTSARAGADSS
jgi:hypothetical protein